MDLDHLNSRERAYRLAQRKARRDAGQGWDVPAPATLVSGTGVSLTPSVTPKSDMGVGPGDPAEAAIRFEVEAVKANVAALAHRHGFAFGWFGDQLRLQFPGSPEVVTVEDAVRRNLIGPGRRW